MFIDIFRRLRDAVKRKRPEKWKSCSSFLLHDNAPAHRLILVMDFLAKDNVTTLEHPPYSPDMDPAVSYLFTRMESALKGRRFCDATDIVKNATEKLKKLSQNVFQKCFQHIYSCWQKWVVARGTVLKEIWLKWLYYFISLRNKVIPEHFEATTYNKTYFHLVFVMVWRQR